MADPVPLADQIAEVRRELALRDRVYPHMVASGKVSEEEAAAQTARMQGVLKTLMWLHQNEDAIRAAIARKRGG